MENQEFEIKVRPERHYRSCDCESCEARRERIRAYFAGDITEYGMIPGAFLRDGSPKRYKHEGVIVAARDVVYLAR